MSLSVSLSANYLSQINLDGYLVEDTTKGKEKEREKAGLFGSLGIGKIFGSGKQDAKSINKDKDVASIVEMGKKHNFLF